MAKQLPGPEMGENPIPVDPANAALPEERGLEEEGYADVLKPFKEKIFEEIKKNAPPGEAASMTVEAMEWLTPDSPTAIASSMMKLTPGLRKIVQGVKFPKVGEEEMGKVVKTRTATQKAFEDMPDDIKAMKRSEAMKALNVQGPPDVPPAPAAAKAKVKIKKKAEDATKPAEPAWVPDENGEVDLTDILD